jgi:hypothetical protein
VGKVNKQAHARAALHDEWQRLATAAAIESARKVIGGAVPPAVPVSKLSDDELGWLVMAGICAWISKRAEQACTDGFNLETAEEFIRETGTTPRPWDAGAVAMVLPDLAEIPGIDWTQPLNAWPRDTMIAFLCAAFRMVAQAIAARDAAENPIASPEPVLNDGVPI